MFLFLYFVYVCLFEVVVIVIFVLKSDNFQLCLNSAITHRLELPVPAVMKTCPLGLGLGLGLVEVI